VRTIGPSIGSDNRDKGIKAGLIGLAAVVVCMLIYYMLAGSIADIALLVNILFILAAMALLRATFTLPGIAGIILTIGMSVDANVLIFERIREEQGKGASLRIAIRNGYQRAFRTILDANVTTFITAAILYWRASEEVKGFALVLMLGIASSMFTALFVTRVIFDLLLDKRIIKEHLAMLRLIHEPKINWMSARPIFLTISIVLIAGGLLVFFTRDDTKNNKYDIEFTGGTNVQISLKDGIELSREEVEKKIHAAGAELGNPALETANIYSVGKALKTRDDGEKIFKLYAINTTETNKTAVTVAFGEAGKHSVDSVASAVKKAASKARTRLANMLVSEVQGSESSYKVSTSQLNKSLVTEVLSAAFPDATISEPVSEEVVNQVILEAFAGQLEIQENLNPVIVSSERIDESVVESYPVLSDFLGGAKILFKVDRAVTIEDFQARLSDLSYKPDVKNMEWYNYRLMGPDMNGGDSEDAMESLVYVSVEPEADLRDFSDDEWTQFVESESLKVLLAGRLETSLPRVTQVDPSIGAEAKTRALIAIALSLFAIVAYIWVRFGDVRYGIAAIVALVHDVCITLGAVVACTYVAGKPIGQALLIGDFKIDLAMIAAFLTLIGYSLNDTIVVFDRIRENRKKAQLNPQIISNSINQMISRTLLTSFTTFIVVLIMYIFGGEGLRGFTFAIGFGIIIGTYSSVAIAAPILLLGKKSSASSKK
jgi:SecD/SecF fusion protein